MFNRSTRCALLCATLFATHAASARADEPEAAPSPTAEESAAPSPAPEEASAPVEVAPSPPTDPAPPPPAEVRPVDAATILGVTFSGMVDAYVSLNPARKSSNLADNGMRAFDVETNRFALSYVELAAERAAGPVGFRVDLGFGPTAALVNSTDIAAGNTGVANIEQAYIQWKPADKVTLKFGKMVTHHGYEVIESQANYNYSRGVLFTWAIPFTHTGVSATVAASPKVDVTFFLLNGLNNTRDNNAFKTPGLQVVARPADGVTVVFNYCAFNEAAAPAGGLFAFGDAVELFDLVATYSHGKTDVGVNVDLGIDPSVDSKSTFAGVAGYVQHTLSDTIKVAGRAELFIDSASPTLGVLGADDGDLAEGTATLSYAPVAGLLLRGEARVDLGLSDFKPFVDRSGGPSGNQVTLTMGAVATF